MVKLSIIVKDMFRGLDKDWSKFLLYYKHDIYPCFKEILLTICKLNNICPDYKDILNAFRLCEYNNTKVVLVGQDPYHTEKYAHGLSFSSMGDKCPPSLRNIFKCLSNQGLLKSDKYTNNLSYWALQGVLLINTALTTIQGQPNKHKKLWSEWSKYFFKKLSDEKDSLIFILWGNNAKKCMDYIDAKKHTVLHFTHPSPLSRKPFNNCPNFIDTNKKLVEMKLKPIDWNPQTSITIYTDGSATKNGTNISKGGYAAIVNIGASIKKAIYGRVPISIYKEKLLYPTNIRAEGYAIIKAIEYANSIGYTSCKIITDSKFWIDMIRDYMPNWSASRFEEKANPDLTKKLVSLNKDNISFIFIRSHGKEKSLLEHVEGNNTADTYAAMGCSINEEYLMVDF